MEANELKNEEGMEQTEQNAAEAQNLDA